MSRKQTWWVAAVVASIALAAGLSLALRHFSTSGAGMSAEAFLAQTFNDLDGQPVAMARWRDRIVVVNFWATWCPPCVEEMPELSELQQKYRDRGLQVVGLGVDSPDNIRKFSEQRPVAYPLLVAGAGGSELSRRFGNRAGGLPYTVVIDRSGRVTRRIIGRFKYQDLRDAIEAVVA